LSRQEKTGKARREVKAAKKKREASSSSFFLLKTVLKVDRN